MTAAARPPALTEDDLLPLLQATASRSLDTCLRGARGLAMLGDPRALPLLLQLSREEDASARAEVCRALAALDDPRAADRLRSLLFDPQAPVRDAAFTALVCLQAADPLQSAEAGLNAAAEDVRRRGLQVLVSFLREQANPAKQAGVALELLARALNDSYSGVRSEAFKAALNLQVNGGGVRTLRFLLQSIHADVRREVLTEVTAQVQEPWAWSLLLEFFNDADPTLREEAFAFAVRKNKELPPLEAALPTQYADVRRRAVEALIKKHTAAAQTLLERALADPDREVRQLALGALVGADARGPLTQALGSPHADVRVRAAQALARHGDAAALQPLLALVQAPEPAERERRADWLALVEAALEGLAELGDAAAIAALTPLLRSDHNTVRRRAAQALAWAAVPNHLEVLRQALQHSDPQVKYHAALGLAYAGDPLVTSLLFSAPAAEVLSRDERLAAAFTLGPPGEDQLAIFLDDLDEPNAAGRTRALLLQMLRQRTAAPWLPTRCLTSLAARPARVRLTAARALERFADPAAFREFVVELLNDRGDRPAWKIPAAVADDLAELLTHGSPAARARTAHLLRWLDADEPAGWDQAWTVHAGRFAAELTELKAQAVKRPPPVRQYTLAQLQDLAFGAYVGLVREQGGSSGRGTEADIVRVRQTALRRLLELAVDSDRQAAARPVLVKALADGHQAVRLQAFDHLVALGMAADDLGAAALGAGHTDVGVRGLEALAGGGQSPEGQAVLEDALRSRTDDLAIEAARLLGQRRGLVPVAALALGAAHEPLRAQAVAWLADEYDRVPAAREALRQALQARHPEVVELAALALARKKDAAAFDPLAQLLHAARDEGPQRRLIQALSDLGDPRAAAVFLDRIEKGPEGTALVNELFAASGSFRRPELVDRLLALGPKWEEALRQVYVISGHDQLVEDPEDEDPDRRWLEKQLPRQDAILARLLRRTVDLKAHRLLLEFLPDARWSRGPDVDPALAVLTVHADAALRHAAVEAVGWRVRKRNGPAGPLVKALKQRDAATQFLAAEGLARGGRDEGLSTLLAAVDLQTDLDLRRRAVTALGELGDLRAMDLLLKLVNDPEHVLRDAAAEALGHMGRSAKAEGLLQMLQDLVREGPPVAVGALRGLRWLDHPEGWQLIRKHAASTTGMLHATAVELLGHNDDPATRDLLLRLLTETDDYEVFENALAGARRLWGEESPEPDYAAVQNTAANDASDVTFRRLQERGDARRLLEILPRLHPEAAERLKGILLMRQPLPVAEAQAVVAGPDAVAAGVAAHLLGRAGPGAAGAAAAVAAALKRWWTEWDRARQEEQRRGLPPGQLTSRLAGTQSTTDYGWLGQTTDTCPSGGLATPLECMIWAAGRLGGATDTLLAIAMTRADVPFDRPLRRAAVAALAESEVTGPVMAALEKLITGDDPEVRAIAAAAIARADGTRAADAAGRLLSDRVAFNRVAERQGERLTAVLRGASAQVHSQGVAVPHLAARGDVAGLAAVAANRGFPEETRLGAVEGLAAAATAAAEAELVRVGQSAEAPEELRKAAWRGLRRSRRKRLKAEATR